MMYSLRYHHHYYHHLQVLFGSRLYESEFQELILMLMAPCVVDENVQKFCFKPSSWNLNCAIKNFENVFILKNKKF